MNPQEQMQSQQQCRTCYNSKNNLQLLKSLPNSWTSQNEQKTYAELLKEVCNIDVLEDVTPLGHWPLFICSVCCEKLKSAYDFIQQTHQINNYLKSLASQYQTKFHFIEILESEIKKETDNDINLSDNERTLQDMPWDGQEADKSETLASTDNGCEDSSNFEDDDLTNEITNDDDDDDTYHPKKSRTNKKLRPTLPCTQCNKLFTTTAKLNRHKRFSHIPEEKKVPCHLCNSKFSRKYHLKRHLQTLHSRNNDKTIVKKEKISNGSNTTTTCEVCGKNFSSSRNMRRHQRLAHVPDEKKFVCLMCGKKIGRSDHFRSHMRNVHKMDVNVLETKRQIQLKNSRFACDKCDRSYTRRYRLYKHERLMHSV